MFFGPVPVRDAAGGILGHSLSAGSERFRKGRLLTAEDVAALEKRQKAALKTAGLQAPS